MEEEKENLKRIRNAMLLGSRVQLKINVYSNPKPFYFKGCILSCYRQTIWFWDLVAGLKRLVLQDIIRVTILRDKDFSAKQVMDWKSKIPKEEGEKDETIKNS